MWGNGFGGLDNRRGEVSMTNFNSAPDVGDPGEPVELYQLLTEHATDLLSLNDPEGRRIWASRSLERLRGRVSTLFENIHPDDLEPVQHWWKQVLAGSAERHRWQIRGAADDWRWLETSAAVLTYRDRAYVLCSARDVTSEKQAEDALQDSARKLKAAVRLAHIGYWEDDVLADRVSWSEEAAHALGAPVSERTGTWREFMQRVHPDDRQYVEERRGRLA
jgi:PAS domain S-box-containing protein